MTYYVGNMPVGEDDLLHYGTKGMKWGRRNYQNRDGSLTAAGRMRYGYRKARNWGSRQYRSAKSWTNRQVRNGKSYYRKNKSGIKRAARVAGTVAGTAALGYLGYKNRGALKVAGKLVGSRARSAGRSVVGKVRSTAARANMKMFPVGSKRAVLRSRAKYKFGQGMTSLKNSRAGATARSLKYLGGEAAREGATRTRNTAKSLAYLARTSRPANTARSLAYLGGEKAKGIGRGLKRSANSVKAATNKNNVSLRKKQIGLYRKTGIKNATLAGLSGKQTARVYKNVDRADNVRRKASGTVKGVKRGAGKVINTVKRGASSVGRKARIGAQVNTAFAVSGAKNAAGKVGRGTRRAANAVKRGVTSAPRKARNAGMAITGHARSARNVIRANPKARRTVRAGLGAAAAGGAGYGGYRYAKSRKRKRR